MVRKDMRAISNSKYSYLVYTHVRVINSYEYGYLVDNPTVANQVGP